MRATYARQNTRRPAGGWALVSHVAECLNIWGELTPWLAVRSFARACAKVAPDVEGDVRAAEFRDCGRTLCVVASSPAAARAILERSGALLVAFNAEVSKIQGPRMGHQPQVAQAAWELRVSVETKKQVRRLPGADYWNATEQQPRLLPAATFAPEVGLELAQVTDDDLRNALTRFYLKATQRTTASTGPSSHSSMPKR